MHWILLSSLAIGLAKATGNCTFLARLGTTPSRIYSRSNTPVTSMHHFETPYANYSWSRPTTNIAPSVTKHTVETTTLCSNTTTTTTTTTTSSAINTTTCATTTSTLKCPHVCHLDFFGTFLEYPTAVVYSPVYEQTVNVYITEFSDGSPGSSSESTVTAPQMQAQSFLTWTAFDVVLTFPTTYVAYTSVNYATVLPDLLQSTCATTSAPLNFPTTWSSLIYPSSEIQQPGSIPPAALIEYLDSLPTVQAQLGNSICDPVNGGISPFVPTATVTSATTISGNNRITHSTSVSVESQIVISAPPPPLSTTTPPPQTSTTTPPSHSTTTTPPPQTSTTTPPPPSPTTTPPPPSTTTVVLASTNAAGQNEAEKGPLAIALAAALFFIR